MYQALYRKYRPKNFNDVVGQEIVIKTLKNAIVKDKISHAYLFAGPRGCGKTTIAKIFAKLVNCENPKNGINCGKCVFCTQSDEQNMDIIEMDAASNNGVDEIREINNKVKLAPTLGKYKIYIIDEVHMLTIGAFNALLKTLEEPPAHVIFILATTDPHKVPITILSRCQRFDLKKISVEKIKERLKYICEQENIKYEENALNEIARLGDGCLRDSIGILDQVISYSDEFIKVSDIYEVNGTISQQDVSNLLINVLDNKLNLVLDDITNFSNNGKSIIKITEEIILYLRNVILNKTANKYQEELYNIVSNRLTIEQILNYISILNNSLLDMKKFSNPKLLLELALIKILSNVDNIQSNDAINKHEIDNKNHQECANNKVPINEQKEKIKVNEKIEEPKNNNIINEVNLKNEQHLTNESINNIKDINKSIKRETNVIEIENKIKEFVNIRVNNTLSSFNKKQTVDAREKIKILDDYVMDEKYSIYVTMILDGELKAVGNGYAIFTYSTKNLANLFNENLNNIENTINELLNINFKLIAVDSDYWNETKEEFNHKTRKFEYKEETINLEDILNSLNVDKDDMKSLFGEIVEYK